MDTELHAQPDLQRLLRRQTEIQRAMRRPGGIRITVERELQAIREQLKRFPLSAQGTATATAQHAGASGAGTTGPHALQATRS